MSEASSNIDQTPTAASATLSPVRLIAVASAFVGLVVDRRDDEFADDGTALLHRWGYWSHYDYATDRSNWPLVQTRTADELAAIAMTKYILRDAPAAGDIFLQRSPTSRHFVRAGVVAEVRGSGEYRPRTVYYDATTIEASTDADGHLGGRYTLRVARRFLPSRGDKFIRWTELDDFVDADGRAVLCRILTRVIPGENGASHGLNEDGELREAA